MRLLDVHLRRVIRLAVSADAPDVIWSPSGSFGILNPLIHHAIRKSQNPDIEEKAVFSNERVSVLITDAIGLVLSGPKTALDVLNWMSDGIPLLIACFRVASGQLIARPETMAVGDVEMERWPDAASPDNSLATQVAAPASIREAAITPEDTRLALQYFEAGGPPAPRGMLVDSLHAYALNDYKKAIVYAAIAMESVAATTLDREFERIVTSNETPDRFRIIKINQAGGVVITKDPVFTALRERIEFRSLLHELSLYVRNSSLLIDNQPLYAEARRVYKTRNDIVHHAEPRAQDDPTALGIDQESSRSAVECALSVCHWFGEGLRFRLYDRQGLTYDRIPL